MISQYGFPIDGQNIRDALEERLQNSIKIENKIKYGGCNNPLSPSCPKYKGGANDFYCGLLKDPRKRRDGTMQECIEDRKVNLYGKYKIDPIAIKNLGKNKKAKQTQDKMKIKAMGLRGKIRKLEKSINSKDAKKAAKAKKDLKQAKDEYKELNKQIK